MDNPGDYALYAGPITTALDRSTGFQSPLNGLDGSLAWSLDFDFKYGSGGTSCSAVVQRSPDLGVTWRDVARADFLTASKVTIFNLEGLLSKGATAYADLASEGVIDGILNGSVRVVLIVVGTYSNTTLAVYLTAR